MINRNEILKLAKTQSAFCISIFIPTHRAGEETYNEKDAIYLKNQLKDVKQKLEEQGAEVRTIAQLLKPAEDLVNDSKFWRHQSDGLAIFIAEDIFEYYTIPIAFNEFNYVSNEFYLQPLMPLFNGGGIFYVLTLKKDGVQLYEGSKHSISELAIDDVVPGQLEDRVGYDHEEKHVQFRTQQGNQGQGMYHGHGDSETDEKDELLQYFKAVDEGVMCVIGQNQTPPLVICAQDHHYGIYKEANSYQNLHEQHISKNPADTDMQGLHAEAKEMLQPYFEEKRNEKADLVGQYLGTGKASSNVADIIPYAVQGMVDTLFLQEGAEVFGKYDITTNEVELHEEKTAHDVSLVNMAAVKVFEQGGTVFVADKENMPAGASEMNALYRTTS